MSLPFKPHIVALLCSAGLLAAAGTLYVQSRTPATIAEPPAQQAPAPAASTTQPVAATYTRRKLISGSPLSRSTRTVCCRRC
nr:Uncharacterised protein [Klebsiella pneumoniae]